MGETINKLKIKNAKLKMRIYTQADGAHFSQ